MLVQSTMDQCHDVRCTATAHCPFEQFELLLVERQNKGASRQNVLQARITNDRTGSILRVTGDVEQI